MLADNLANSSATPNFPTIGSRTTIERIIAFIEGCAVEFQNRCAGKALNEDQYTQELLFTLLQEGNAESLPFIFAQQYIDTHEPGADLRRKVDLCVVPAEKTRETKSIFSIEAKRLPAPTLDRLREYVAGSTGGIERFKNEAHGKNMSHCGMLAFVESKTFHHWQETINSWITELANTDGEKWNNSETLFTVEEVEGRMRLTSVHQRSTSEVILTHIWIRVGQ